MKDKISPDFFKEAGKVTGDPYPDTRESFNKNLKPLLDKLCSLPAKNGEKFEPVGQERGRRVNRSAFWEVSNTDPK